ncbi:M10 family metallopeptidase C-terminal domain-containing protein [Microvirga mediterraneensis]|uniref:Cadherin domain-containing protein n=1 Tax=Microvirga mediterraneensis TaxID=2754695 RepID=A0A838BTN0_9HYPH|nr:hypothetical protein [Microvirga mediterraneensis]MBA1158718.1 hypothetical protein [Microvirga mediterraneensis]
MTLIRIGEEVQITGDMPHFDYEVTGSSVAALPNGGWVIVWSAVVESRTQVLAQVFNPLGIAYGPPERVNKFNPTSETIHPVVTALSDGSWVVTWADVTDSGDTIYQGHFAGIAPPQLSLHAGPIAEASGTGALIGNLSLANANPTDTGTMHYQLVDDAGGRFMLEGAQLKVRDGLKLDYEQATAHTITVKVVGSTGFSLTQTLTVQVGDVARENVMGNDFAHYLVGGADIDIFNGLGGNDTLSGGSGKDTLTGGAGKDAFVFNTKPNKKTNLDTIKDFRAKDDDIWLDDAVFKGIGKAGTMAAPKKIDAKAFYSGSKAHDSNDRIIWNKDKGVLYYDPDGVGSKAQIAIAKLPKKALSAGDFFVI